MFAKQKAYPHNSAAANDRQLCRLIVPKSSSIESKDEKDPGNVQKMTGLKKIQLVLEPAQFQGHINKSIPCSICSAFLLLQSFDL